MQWTSFFVVIFSTCLPTYQAILWRERSDYPKDYDHFQVYVAEEAVPITGERALTDGCGDEGRPYKYRGKRHIPELRKALKGAPGGKVWVAAVDTTTPWIWTNGQPLYQLEGQTSSHQYRRNNVRIPGNNVFLCSLQCQQVAFILVQGNRCACSTSRPKLLPPSGTTLRCPGTYGEFCGTFKTYSVYRNMLADTVQWASLVDRSRYHGNRAYLYRSHQTLPDQPEVTLKAEVDSAAEKGYVCNGTVLTTGNTHIEHIWAMQERHSALTWRNAMMACMNKGRQLATLSRDDEACVPEVKEKLKRGQSYWVGLSRQHEALWLDGTTVKTSVHHRKPGQANCLTMSLTRKTPSFAFESCTSTKLHVLCEKGDEPHLHSYTHDAAGNHIITHSVTEENESSGTVPILVSVLVALTLLSIVLVIVLCNRDKWLPKKSHTTNHRIPTAHNKPTLASSVRTHTNPDDVDIAVISLSKKPHEPPRNKPRKADQSRDTDEDFDDYAVLTKGKESRPQQHRNESDYLHSGYPEYSEVEIPDNHYTDRNNHVKQDRRNTTGDFGSENRRPSAVRILDCGIDSSQSSVTGSDDAYSVLSYRKAIQKAWTGFKRTAYAHIMIHSPKKSSENDDASVYDVTRTRLPPVRCIDNDYDHAEPCDEPPRDVYVVSLAKSDRKRPSESGC